MNGVNHGIGGENGNAAITTTITGTLAADRILDIVEKIMKYDGMIRTVSPVLMNIYDGIIGLFQRAYVHFFIPRDPETEPRNPVQEYTVEFRLDSIPKIVGIIYRYLEEKYDMKINRFVPGNDGKTVSYPQDVGLVGDGMWVRVHNCAKEDKDDERRSAYSNKMSLSLMSVNHTRVEFINLIEEFIAEANMTIKTPVNIIMASRHGDGNNLILGNLHRPRISRDKMIHVPLTDRVVRTFMDRPRGNALFYGPPGTGKTTLIRQIADEMGATIIHVNLNIFSTIYQLISMLTKETIVGVYKSNAYFLKPAKRIVIFEDFDTMLPKKFWIPLGKLTEVEEKVYVPVDYTYSDLLNMLDGIISIDGLYTIWTTNDMSCIPESFYRPGRMNVCEKVDKLSVNDARLIMGGNGDTSRDLTPVLGGDLRLAQVVEYRETGRVPGTDDIDEDYNLERTLKARGGNKENGTIDN